LGDGCYLDSGTIFNNNNCYATALSESGTFDFNGQLASNTVGDEDGAALTAADSNALVEGTGVDAGVGVDIDGLHFITEEQVGPNSTWTAAD